MRAHRIVGCAVGLAAVGLAAGLPFIDAQGGYAGLSPRFLPMLVCAGLASCGALIGFRPDALAPVDPPAAQAPFPGRVDGTRSVPARSLAWLLGGLLGHALLIAHLGFVLASVLLMVGTARAFGSRRPLRDALVGLALALPVWLLFAQVFRVGLRLLPVAGF